MSEFLMEMHCHTEESSSCGRVPAAQIVEMYIESGYDGIVITDHFQFSEFGEVNRREYKKKAQRLAVGYEEALKAADGRIVILRGAEIRLPRCNNDYLVYGVDDSFIHNNVGIRDMDITQLSQLCRESGLLIFQAHPFRNGMTVVKPDLIDGIEVFNGNPRHQSRNEIAVAWAKMHELRGLSGSDFHQVGELAGGGVYFDSPVASSEDLISLIRQGRYRLK